MKKDNADLLQSMQKIAHQKKEEDVENQLDNIYQDIMFMLRQLEKGKDVQINYKWFKERLDWLNVSNIQKEIERISQIPFDEEDRWEFISKIQLYRQFHTMDPEQVNKNQLTGIVIQAFIDEHWGEDLMKIKDINWLFHKRMNKKNKQFGQKPIKILNEISPDEDRANVNIFGHNFGAKKK